ncbi:MAG: BMP family ABC transporter substrate-binding protein, partial [Chloroflexota bacterium]
TDEEATTEESTTEEATTEEAAAEEDTAEESSDAFKVAFVYVSPVGDLGWTWAHDQGRLAVEEAFGDKVETAFIELVPEGPEAERVIRDFAQKGFDLVITTSFGYMDPTITVAQEFPDVQFVHVSGFKNADNVSNIFGRMYQPRYLSGLAAGAATESNIVGYVAAFPIPEVIRGINAFTVGVREVNPDAEVRVVWTNTWFGPPEEKEAAEALLSAGADVIAQHQDTTEPQKAAADAGGFSIGYNADMAQVVGDTVLASPIWDWGVKYIDITQQVMDGTYDGSESYWGGMDEGIVTLAPLSAGVSGEIADMISSRTDQIVSGEFDVFCGPITGANGTVVVEKGKCLNDGEMLSMDYFIEGVQGEAPAEAPEGLGEESAMMGAGGDAMMAEEEAAAEPAGDPIKVAFVYVAPIGDLGWTFAHDQGRLAIEEELGFETAFIELVPEGPEAERVIRDFAQKDFKLIFTTSFGYMDPTITVASEFPDTQFVHISGFKNADNASNVFGRMYQPRYLSGLVAGAATESNVIGYVAAFPIPEVLRGINAFTLGVREVNPDAEVRVVWTNTWFGPPEEKEAADALISAGADVIAQHQDTTEPQKAAADADGLSIGYNSDMAQFVGDTVLTGPVWNWGVKYVEIAQQVSNGTYDGSESYWGGMDGGIVGLAPLSDRVSEETAALVEERSAAIIAGETDVFCGPITGANGNLVVEEGKCLNDGEMLSMDYFVEGVEGEEVVFAFRINTFID